jgi:Fic family protein
LLSSHFISKIKALHQHFHADMSFDPKYALTPEIAGALMRIESFKQAVSTLPITPRVMANLRETARLFSTHYSTQIEGNRLTQEQVAQVVEGAQHFPGRERDESEVRGYYAALDELERQLDAQTKLTEATVRKFHALVMAGGKTRIRPTAYRDGQNVIRDGKTGSIVYLPPEAKDVPALMQQLIAWIRQGSTGNFPIPLKAAIVHYQFATIHPYYDGNGRTARLLTNLVLHLGGYGLNGFYALEEYYARDLRRYYEALTIGPSHNYYMGRVNADITKWIAYFIDGMADSFRKVHAQAKLQAEKGAAYNPKLLRNLDARQRKALTLFQDSREVTAKQFAELFGFQSRNAAILCNRWEEAGFIEATNRSKKARRYQLTAAYEALMDLP